MLYCFCRLSTRSRRILLKKQLNLHYILAALHPYILYVPTGRGLPYKLPPPLSMFPRWQLFTNPCLNTPTTQDHSVHEPKSVYGNGDPSAVLTSQSYHLPLADRKSPTRNSRCLSGTWILSHWEACYSDWTIKFYSKYTALLFTIDLVHLQTLFFQTHLARALHRAYSHKYRNVNFLPNAKTGSRRCRLGYNL